MKKKDFDSKTYNFSDCREITGEELYLINGGERVENSNEAVANAQVGDTVERKDGTEVTITQGDIDWAQAHTGTGGTDPSQATPATSESTPESQPSTPTNSSSTTGSTSQANTTNSSSSPSQSSTITKSSNLTDRGYPSSTEGYSNSSAQNSQAQSMVVKKTAETEVDTSSSTTVSFMIDPHDPNRVIVDLDDKQSMQYAANLLSDPFLEYKVTAYGSKSGETRTFKNYSEINSYLNKGNTKTIGDKLIEKITYFHFEARDSKNTITESFEDISKSANTKDGDWVLLTKEMSKYHQNGFGADELKFVCKDGREAVFTKDFSSDGSYELYTDPQYKGTYNYCNPTTNPIGHFFADMLPYYLTGNRNERNQ